MEKEKKREKEREREKKREKERKRAKGIGRIVSRRHDYQWHPLRTV